jgi:mono/diheme cytochrome c family protein
MRFLAAIGAIAIVVAIGLGVFFFGGFFDIAAANDDPAPVAWVLKTVRIAAIRHHSGDTPPVKLDDKAVITAGARAYAAAGCANCHGGPGVNWAKFSEGLNPGPPDLADAGKEIEPPQLFYAIKNGIRMTGMPSFAKAGVSDRDIWQITAFVKAMPGVSEADYKSWTAEGGGAGAGAPK